MEDLKQAVADANKALEKRPKDKFYNAHKAELEKVIQNYVATKIMFIKEMLQKAEAQVAFRHKLKLKKQKYLEETKGIGADQEKNDSDDDTAEDFSYPEECQVLDIMKEKYYDAVQFFNDTEDKK